MMKKNSGNGKNSRLQGRWIFFVLILFLALAAGCESDEEYPQHNPPADHTVNNEGVMHKSGLSDPQRNCTACHGADLKGGSVQVSCFECHGVKW